MADSYSSVGIIGAGAMGAGIAQVAATHGWQVKLLDVDVEVVAMAIASIRKRIDRLVEKGRLTAEQGTAACDALNATSSAPALAECDLVIEAIVEDFDVKKKVLGDLAAVLSPDAIIATNTSSLSVTDLGEAIGEAPRTLGMHFFNPAPLMKLVEVIPGRHTRPDVADRAAEIASSWGKKVARAADVPGFIVNHVARPYYLEAFRILEDGLATPDVIDGTMKTIGGFRMGPLELTDLIGQDVNTATTRSVWEQLDRPPLLHPSPLQERLVSEGHLGRKTGRGVYDHSGDTPTVALQIEQRDLELPDELRQSVDCFVSAVVETAGDGRQNYVLARILVALIAQAAHAHQRGVATPADIDTALKYGTNYPRGPFEWARVAGYDLCEELLGRLNATVSDNRFAVPGGFQSITVP